MEKSLDNIFLKELKAINLLKDYINNSSVSISGGKDSLVALDISIKVGIKNFVFANTSLAFPGTIEYIKELEKYYGIQIEQVKAPREFLDIINDIGVPSQRLRWCCEVYKFGPLSHYVLQNKIKYLITGIRSEESRKRQNYAKISRNPLIPAIQINPILDWNKDQIWEYIKYHKLPYHPLYNKGYERLGCWMCPFQKSEGFEKLKTNFKDLYIMLENLIRKNIEKFGGVGIKDSDDYIKSYAWTKNALPIKNIIKGSIEYTIKNDQFYFNIKSDDYETFSKLKINSKLISEKSIKYSIDDNSFTIQIVSRELNINKVLIYCEKQINCIGCGACRSLCLNSAIFIENQKMHIDFSKCTFCLDCLFTTKLRAGCIARNYLPIRYKFKELNLLEEISNRDKGFREIKIQEAFKFKNSEVQKFEKSNENIGLLKTKKPIYEVLKILDGFLENEPNRTVKTNEFYYYSFDDFIIFIKKERGYTIIYFNCWNKNINTNLNFIMNILKK